MPLRIVWRGPTVVVHQAPVHKIPARVLRDVEPVTGLVMNHEIDEAHIRHIRRDSRNDLDVGRFKPDAGLRAEAVRVRAVQFKISEDHISRALIECQRTVNARPLSRHLPECNGQSGRSLDFGVHMSNRIVAAAQPKRISRLSNLA